MDVNGLGEDDAPGRVDAFLEVDGTGGDGPGREEGEREGSHA
jgi:hypothetical protein